jgi:hypothetical protein
MSTALVTHQEAFLSRWYANWAYMYGHPEELREMRRLAMIDLARPLCQKALRKLGVKFKVVGGSVVLSENA